MIHSETSQLLSPVIYNSQSNAVNMKWRLAHFGLDLASPEDYIKSSVCEITQEIEDIGAFAFYTDNSALDVKLNGPNTEHTLLTCVGHIVLQVPVPRPECLDQIVEIINTRELLAHPLKRFGKSYSPHFILDKGDEETATADPFEIYDALSKVEQSIIHGNEQTEHNVMGSPNEMMLTVLPVPSILVRTEPSMNRSKLSQKINTIVRLNNTIRNLYSSPDFATELSSLLIQDLNYLLSYHVMTYLDNTIPGIATDTELDAGIAQYLGISNSILQGGTVSDMEVGGTSLQRIVRCINSGEKIIIVEGGSAENLCFELSKQIAFNRIWKKSERETQVVHIDETGEVQRMEIGVIRDFHWGFWDGESVFEPQDIVAPRYSLNRTEGNHSSPELKEIIGKLKQMDPDFRLYPQEHLAASHLYTTLSKSGTDVAEQQIIICEVSIDRIVLGPVLRHLREKFTGGQNICLLLIGTSVENAAKFKYLPTPDEYRNLIISLTELKERQDLEEKSMNFSHILSTELKLISTYLKGLSRAEIRRILGSVLVAKGKLDTDYIRDYIKEILIRENKEVDHLNPNPRVERRRLTREDIYDGTSMNFEKKFDEVEEESSGSLVGDPEEEEAASNDSLYDSLKGLEPLVHWAKRKGNLFTPEAKEYGFVRYPKGLLLTGVPGCGKTMAAKIIAEEWGMSLTRVNPDDVTSRFMGANEENIRKILDTLVENAPSICFIDEAEKLFTQMNDGIQGASSQSIDSTESILLQFMEENNDPVFFVFTCNDINKMSPALIDRFDACFFVDLPDKDSRAEIIQLMLKERKKDGLGLVHEKLAANSNGFTGRDIRGAIEESMMNAFSENRELEQSDLEMSFQQISSTSSTHEKQIEAMRSLVKQGKVRSANTTRIVIKTAEKFDVSIG